VLLSQLLLLHPATTIVQAAHLSPVYMVLPLRHDLVHHRGVCKAHEAKPARPPRVAVKAAGVDWA